MKRKLICIMAIAFTTWIIRAALNPHITELDLSIDGVADYDEFYEPSPSITPKGPGGFVCSNGWKKITLKAVGVNDPMKTRLNWNSARIEVWTATNGGTQVSSPTLWDPASSMPTQLWVKGVSSSATGPTKDASGNWLTCGPEHMTLEAINNGADPTTPGTYYDRVAFTVFSVDSIKFHKNPFMTDWKAIDQVYKNIGVYTDHTAWFAVNTTPSDLTIPNGLLTWGGLASGTTPSVLVTFSVPNFLEEVTVMCGGTTKSAWVAIRDQPSGIGEELYCYAWPVYTAIAWERNLINPDPTAVIEPESWAIAAYPGAGHNTVQDAARHAYWTCLLRRYTCAGYALGLTTQHEVSGVGPCTETIMDLHNNLMGIDIEGDHTHTSGLGCCRAAVQSAVSVGTLWYLDSSYGAENTAEDALLQPTNR